MLMSESPVKRKLVSLRFPLHVIGKAGADQNADEYGGELCAYHAQSPVQRRPKGCSHQQESQSEV